MKYALTFTNPETYDWNETDTIIIDTPKNPLDVPLNDLTKALAVSGVRDYNEEGWKDILGNDSWYVRNCDDQDADLWGIL